MAIRNCQVCNALLKPYHWDTMTAHEFQCYKEQPSKVPSYHAKNFETTLAWEKRSKVAKLAAKKRQAKRLSI